MKVVGAHDFSEYRTEKRIRNFREIEDILDKGLITFKCVDEKKRQVEESLNGLIEAIYLKKL